MFCAKVKEFLSANGIHFIERDVTKDEEAISELEKLGVMTTPVTLIDDEIIIGYDISRLKSIFAH